ncbi:zinc finger and SCAN domain-containing protein 29-like [Heteronotia binoei]|uniref:zinc finger and SCAN domain-containing protein 29-like n=1 Tax=Heteronotia binoei TaxID=13085 RepID=UPI00292D9007|nr:zinc finger and SCAN domain-containing protein 29-like [Heteronotia binoei]XP_060093769.1 zinc finger and SCAN domain-containing protein 29-like [Heteronotia binoei]
MGEGGSCTPSANHNYIGLPVPLLTFQLVQREDPFVPGPQSLEEKKTSSDAHLGIPDVIIKVEEEENPSGECRRLPDSHKGVHGPASANDKRLWPGTEERRISEPMNEARKLFNRSLVKKSASKPSGVRGVSWRRDETLDLLALWGEQNVQEALRSCHRNIDSFEMISKEMAKRGHSRTAVECRTKAKALRLEYKRVVTLNSQTGSNRATCPYFEELHRILRGDASVKPKRVPRSLSALRKPAEPQRPRPVLQEGLEQLLTHHLPMVKVENNTEDMHCSNPAPSGTAMMDPAGSRPTTHPKEEADEMPIEEAATPAHTSGDEEQCARTPESPTGSARGGVDAEAHPAELSPATRLANARAKKRRVPGLYSVAERMMEQSSREHALEMEERRREHSVEKKRYAEDMAERRRQHEEMMAEMRADREEAREDRRLVEEALQRNFRIMEAAMKSLDRLGELIVQQQQSFVLPSYPMPLNSHAPPAQQVELDPPAALPSQGESQSSHAHLSRPPRVVRPRAKYSPDL